MLTNNSDSFRPIRRADHALSADDGWDILERNKYGMFAVNGDNGYPYSVPMFYVIIDEKVYIHGTVGPSHRTESIARDNKFCFTVSELDGDGTSGRSVVIMGSAIPREDMRAQVLLASAKKFFPTRDVPAATAAIEPKVSGIEAYELQIAHFTVKALAANVFKKS